MPGLEDIQERSISTPFGDPSSPIVIGQLGDQSIAFLARHGIGHHISPSEINFRANIYALKSLGVERIVAISAYQLFDFTKGRERTFFGQGLVAHVSLPDPFCPDLSERVYQAVKETGNTIHMGGTYITVEGPRFSTRAESNAYRSWGMSLIGMTTSPEAFLAKEAEICYTSLAHVTDYDVWHISEEPVTVEMVIEILNRNTTIAQQAINNLVGVLDPERLCDCEDTLASALITDPKVIPAETRQRLSLLVDKYLD
jgi:5'-methylthioadenosine phosphorylase